MVVDRLGTLGAEVVPPSAQVIANLAAQDIPVAPVPLTDIPMGRSEGGRYTAILSELLASDHCDAVVAVVGSSARDTQVVVDRALKARARERKPLGVFLAPRADEGLALLEANGVAGFRTPESCADAVHAYLEWRAPSAPEGAASGELAAAEAAAARFRDTRLDERQSGELFAALGVPVAESRVLARAEDGCDLGGSLAVKVLSADIPHKTEAGAVRLDVSAADLAAASRALLASARAYNKDARIAGILVQRMERGLAEVIVGYRRDPEVGPVIMLGAGGAAAEIAGEPCVRLAPVSLDEAREMIDSVRALAPLRGYRNLPPGDCAALAQAVRALSLLALLETRTVAEAEINPLIVKAEGRGVVAVDGLVVFSAE
jgi:acyl-CoA synthetase (NDP forming)